MKDGNKSCFRNRYSFRLSIAIAIAMAIVMMALLAACSAAEIDQYAADNGTETVTYAEANSSEAVIDTGTDDNTAVKDQQEDKNRGSQSISLDQLISQAILEENADSYYEGECPAEGHIILDIVQEDEKLTAYTLAMYGWYQFQNNNFVKCSGSGVIPTVITFEWKAGADGEVKSFDLTEDSMLEADQIRQLSYEVPLDGDMYVDSIKKLFPQELWDVCLKIREEDHVILKEREQANAALYLDSIGRQAQIGDYRDFTYTYLSDMGISTEVSNEMLNVGKYIKDFHYPDWLGYVECLEEGVRYLYYKELDQEHNRIVFTKRNYETVEVVECYAFDAETGKQIEDWKFETWGH